jgi:hypothetical protein
VACHNRIVPARVGASENIKATPGLCPDYELLSQTLDVRRILEPNGRSIERPELDEHFDEGRFPGLRRYACPIDENTSLLV